MTHNTAPYPKGKSIRVFFALWPDPDIQQQLYHFAQKLKQTCKGRVIQQRNIHLTLAFLGHINIDRLPELKLAANQVTTHPFSLTIQEVGYWKRNEIVYAKATTFPSELFLLAESLKNTLLETGFTFDQKTFKPHITLLRQAQTIAPTNLPQPIHWPVKEWCLLQSNQTPRGVNYTPLDCWPLNN